MSKTRPSKGTVNSSTSSLDNPQCPCSVCDKHINDETEESIFCEGVCKDWIHRKCAGLSRAAFNSACESSDDYLCHYCSSLSLRDEIKILKERISTLEAEKSLNSPTSITRPGQPEREGDVSPSYSQAAKGTSKPETNNQHSHQQKDQIKYSVVVYGIKECPKGSSRLTRSTNDVKEVTEIFQIVNPDLPNHSICDCTRLGKYNTEKNRPILVKLSRSHEAMSILDNRKKLNNCPGVSIKPLLTKEQLSIEAILLKERWKLIQSGSDRSNIKIRGNSLHHHNSIYGSVVNNKFVLNNDTTSGSTPFLGGSPVRA